MKNRCHYLQTSYLFSSVCIYGYWSQHREKTSFNAHAATFTEITQHFASVTYDAVRFLTPPSLSYRMRHRMWSIYTGNTLCCSEEAFVRLYFCVACVYVLREKKRVFLFAFAHSIVCTFFFAVIHVCVSACIYLCVCICVCLSVPSVAPSSASSFPTKY